MISCSKGFNAVWYILILKGFSLHKVTSKARGKKKKNPPGPRERERIEVGREGARKALKEEEGRRRARKEPKSSC